MTETAPIDALTTTPPVGPEGLPEGGSYGVLDLVFGHGDIVLQGTFLFMVVMSVLSWTFILYRIWFMFQLRKHYKAHKKAFMQTNLPIAEVTPTLQGNSSVKDFLLAAQNATEAFDKIDSQKVSLSFSEYLTRQIRQAMDRVTHSMDGGLTLLATVGATAPFVGLFGTVWGIYHALINISQMGSVNIATIAGPIGEALIATAFGLFVAIPAVLAYNYFNRQNRLFTRDLDSLAHDVYTYTLSQANKE